MQIRSTKLVAAERGYDALMAGLKIPAPAASNVKAAIIGGGPTGISAGFFLGRAGISCTIFEKADVLGGIVRQVIPSFRISSEAIDKDIAMGILWRAAHPGAIQKLLRPFIPPVPDF